MGHDISGYKVSDTKQENEIAYLRRGAFNPLNKLIYDALDSPELYGGCSGFGDSKTFSKDQILNAMSNIGCGDLEEGEEIPEIKFLQDCLDNMEGDKITIYFG